MERLTFRTQIELVVSKDGKVLQKLQCESHSWLKNFLAWFRARLLNSTDTVRKLDGSSATAWGSTSYDGHIDAYAGQADRGIVVGTGSTPVTADDYCLASKIAHGTGIGQLQYGAQTLEPLAPVTGGYTLRIIRTFTNGSPSTVTVNEIGIQMSMYDGSAAYYVLVARDVLPASVSVPVGSTLTVRYIVTVTV